MIKMANWFCKFCPLTGEDCGSWDDEHEYFGKIKQVHKDHLGFQIGEPIPIDKLTTVEQTFTNYFNDHFDEWFHSLVAELKGTNKVCLLKDKPDLVRII